MINERDLKTRVRGALDDVLPPAPWLEAVVTQNLNVRLGHPARPARRRFAFTGAAAALLALALAAAFLLAQLYVPPPVPGAPTGMTPAESSQLASLEARSLNYPTLSPSAACPTTPMTLIHPWASQADSGRLSGTGPGYIPSGGVGIDNDQYFDVTFYLDPTARGVVLFRGRNLTTGRTIYFTGQWSAGTVIANDTLGGRPAALRPGVAFPSDRPPHNALAAPGWGLWTGRWRSAFNTGDCVAFQVDYATGTELIVFNG